ncbi:hypothetical protein JYU34_008755 [Plutella xylostella]|uniref:Uncharacterized protein n=1 Tax=Plutella xylostella TaxID=51655 RepID=A0ABQ7QLQ3_PLUXY|nr:uncharacterized protein LOC105383284 [Plutella xylostella]KAG7306160.1 hypothetical protein JYU34_008755 [Plutella xylostella]
MGIKLIILLALLVGVLYCIHLLVKDYQAVTAPRLLRLLFKRDLSSSQKHKPYVRWKKILHHDAIQCARFVYCSLGYEPLHSEVQGGFVYMLTLPPREEDKSSMEAFQGAYDIGEAGKRSQDDTACRRNYPRCPFTSTTLFDIIEYLLKHQIF